MFLGKKLLVVPMKDQFEQQYNAIALQAIGVRVMKRLKKKYFSQIQEWLDSNFKIQIEYPDITNRLINIVFEIYLKELLDTKLKKGKIKLKI